MIDWKCVQLLHKLQLQSTKKYRAESCQTYLFTCLRCHGKIMRRHLSCNDLTKHVYIWQRGRSNDKINVILNILTICIDICITERFRSGKWSRTFAKFSTNATINSVRFTIYHIVASIMPREFANALVSERDINIRNDNERYVKGHSREVTVE